MKKKCHAFPSTILIISDALLLKSEHNPKKNGFKTTNTAFINLN